MNCIFNEQDLKILYDVLKEETKFQFPIAILMYTMCTLPEKLDDRKLYYPLFLFGGFLSCKEVAGERDFYLLHFANESLLILLNYHLEILFEK